MVNCDLINCMDIRGWHFCASGVWARARGRYGAWQDDSNHFAFVERERKEEEIIRAGAADRAYVGGDQLGAGD